MESKIKIGTIRKHQVDERGKRRPKQIWLACPDCGKERWISVVNNLPINVLCRHCFQVGDKHYNWKGGRITDGCGYIKIYLFPDDFFYPMAKKNSYVLEHRLVMAKHLGRCLHRWEIIHHKNGIKDDNRIENLQLVSDDRHKQLTILERRIVYLEKKMDAQEKEIRLLKWKAKQEVALS